MALEYDKVRGARKMKTTELLIMNEQNRKGTHAWNRLTYG